VDDIVMLSSALARVEEALIELCGLADRAGHDPATARRLAIRIALKRAVRDNLHEWLEAAKANPRPVQGPMQVWMQDVMAPPRPSATIHALAQNLFVPVPEDVSSDADSGPFKFDF
jgi:hypothetical protein